ncbi:Pr6Pr family membrane protein [Saccharopolyspora sp. K220]|uniref:Pr6Pr family membrane protein n=1 Tax=Saccharopolyspora soli TaxID=2926618 RepID=UPI001F5A3137|nr:Pr6Pr family membrane protein [Saccharopolyspora soli]MCI2415818.1 Pr6Pr family membrane protein [Saccharopolyspora soli]
MSRSAAIAMVLDPVRAGRGWRVLQLDALLGITITGVVFAFVLAKLVHLTGVAYLVTVGFHYISRWMMLIGWLLFGPRPRIRWSTVAWAFGWPVLWIAYTFVHGALVAWYPYPFLNPDRLGFSTALTNTLLVLVAAGVLMLIRKAVDTWLPVLPLRRSARSGRAPVERI